MNATRPLLPFSIGELKSDTNCDWSIVYPLYPNFALLFCLKSKSPCWLTREVAYFETVDKQRQQKRQPQLFRLTSRIAYRRKKEREKEEDRTRVKFL